MEEERWKVSEFFEPEKLSINQWDAEDRPREKLAMKGPEALSNAELLGILIGSGNKKENAVELMRKVLNNCGGSLKKLGKMPLKTLQNYDGIGEAKAITILAACELGKRRQREDNGKRPDMSDAQKVYEYMHPLMQDLSEEEGWLLLLNHNFKLMCEPIVLSHGGLTETAIDVRVMMKHIIMNDATVVVLCHNHPSNNPRPSRQDDGLTQSIKKACELMRIHFADHIIITDGEYYSYRESGRI